MTMNVETDLRNMLGPARDQGIRPTCLAFAATAAHEASRTTTDYLSTEHLFFSGVQRSHGNPERGLNPTSVSEALKYDGQPVEEAWPYQDQVLDVATWVPPSTTQAFHKAAIVFLPRTVAEIRGVLQGRTPVLLLVSVTTAMYTPDADSIVRSGPSDATTARLHALLAVGSGHAHDGNYVLVRNSWGLSWGDLGHAWLPDAYLASQLHSTGVIS